MVGIFGYQADHAILIMQSLDDPFTIDVNDDNMAMPRRYGPVHQHFTSWVDASANHTVPNDLKDEGGRRIGDQLGAKIQMLLIILGGTRKVGLTRANADAKWQKEFLGE